MPRRFPTDLSRRSVIGLLGLGAVLLNTRGHSAASHAERRSRFRQSPAGAVHLAFRARAQGPGRHHRLDPEAARLRLSQRHPDRCLDLLDRQAGPFDARRRLYRPGEGQGAYLGNLRRADAGYGAADLEGHRAACRRPAGLSRLAWLRSPAERVRRESLCHHPDRNAGDPCRWSFRPGVRCGPRRHSRHHGQGRDRSQNWRQVDSVAEFRRPSCQSSCRAPT